jgi:hypothetical protein
MITTWTCMVCGRERDDDEISVASGRFTFPRTGVEMQTNIRYCNDDPDCEAEAKLKANTAPDWTKA